MDTSLGAWNVVRGAYVVEQNGGNEARVMVYAIRNSAIRNSAIPPLDAPRTT
jgi:hypothetical protein